MTIIVDSPEYQCWHELGHAVACLQFGGEVEFIEFLINDPRGYAMARCIVIPEMNRLVACAGFAAEFYLLKYRLADKAPGDDRDINAIVFHNATADREAFWERDHTVGDGFSEQEDREFMNHAVEYVAPLFDRYFRGMEQLVGELFAARRLEGYRIKEVLKL
jgi:hypothetical protein